MNLTQPPFDDIHVRKAAELGHGQGAASSERGAARSPAQIANHIVPDTMFNGDLDDYAPYGTRTTRATSRRPRKK